MNKKLLFFLSIFYLLSCFYTLTIQSTYAQTNRRTAVIVTDFEIVNMENFQIQLVRESITAYLVNLGKYSVVERAMLVNAIKELKFSESDLTDSYKVIRIGKLLSAEGLIVGSIIRTDNKIIITARLLETQTGRIIRVSKISYLQENDLDKACKILAYELANEAQKVKDERETLEKTMQTIEAEPQFENKIQREEYYRMRSRFFIGARFSGGISWMSDVVEKDIPGERGHGIWSLGIDALYYLNKSISLKFDVGFSSLRAVLFNDSYRYDTINTQIAFMFELKRFMFYAGVYLGFKVDSYPENSSFFTYDFGTSIGTSIGFGFTRTWKQGKFIFSFDLSFSLNKPITIINIGKEYNLRTYAFYLSFAFLYGA